MNMGLLTDPTGHGKPTQYLMQYHRSISVLLYFASLLWFALLAHENFNSGSYFSENALLPGLVKGEFDLDSDAKIILEELEAEAERFPDSVPTTWLLAKLNRLNLDTYTHNFTLHYPLGKGTKYTGKNVYGILRAPRSASTEAIVISLPYRPPSSAHLTTAPGLALLLALAKFFRKQKYWAKDIIFLITEHEQLGIQAWLEAYHAVPPTNVLEHGELMGRGGAIQAAINLEIHSAKIGHIDVKLLGLNGQLPNLDLVNLVHRMCSKEGVRHTFSNKEKMLDKDWFKSWLNSFSTLISMVLSQATSVPDGNHGLFHRFGIEAVTLEGFEKVGRSASATFYQVGRVLEGLLRSLNNLLERFHQSYFFYLLPEFDRYISIGLYMPCLGMLAAALFIKAFAQWLSVQYSLSDVESTADLQLPNKDPIVYNKLNIVGVGVSMLATHILGVVLLSAGPLFTTVTSFSTENSLYFGFVAVSLLTVVIPPVLSRLLNKNGDWTLLNILALLELATLLLAVAMHNFSLAFITGVIYILPALWIQPNNNRWWAKMMWMLFHPFLVLFVVVLLTTWFTFPELGWSQLLARAVSAKKHALVLSCVDYLIYGNCAFSVAIAFFTPTWILMWIVCHSSQQKYKEKKD